VRNRGAGGEGESMQQRRRDENSLRVTNLSEDVSEADLQVGAWVSTGRLGF
jgi:translation initiation factor 3 subunit G